LAIVQLSFSFDLAAYKQQYQTQVEVPYKNAVTVAATDIIEYLAKTPVPTTADAGRQIVTTLNTKAQTFFGRFKRCCSIVRRFETTIR